MALRLHPDESMRAHVLTIAFGCSLLAACGAADPNDELGGGGRRSSGSATTPAAGDQHDPDDLRGATSADPGNPSASAPPPPPTQGGTPAADFDVQLSTAQPAVDLGDEVSVDVTVQPKNAFKGSADLSVTGLPADVTATFTPSSVVLNGTPAAAKLVLKAAYTAVGFAPGASVPVVVAAKSGAEQATANANFRVNSQLTLVVPAGINDLRKAGVGTVYIDEWGAPFGSKPQALKTKDPAGIVVLVKNADSTAHIIHGANGFAHGDVNNPIAAGAYEMQNGKPRERLLKPTTNANGYPHEGANGPSVSFRIQVQSANE